MLLCPLDVLKYFTLYFYSIFMLLCPLNVLKFFTLCFSDIWSLGCVLYELATLKHAVSIATSSVV